MLQQIRDKISGWFAALFLGAIAVVFIFWGIQFESPATAAAAKVNGESIPQDAVRRAWQDRQTELQQQLRDELPPELVKSEQERLVSEFIQRELLTQRAHDLGYRVSDSMLAETITAIPAVQVDGKFSRDRYAALLRAQGRTEAGFEDEMRKDLEIGQLRDSIGLSGFVTPGELRRRVELAGEARDFDYVTLPVARYLGSVAVTPADVSAWYEKNKSSYMTDETVSLQYVELDLADVARNIEVTEEGLRKFYDQVAVDRYTTTERRRSSHILVESGTDDAAAQKEAEQLAARAKAGEDFAKLASANSDDPGSKQQGGDLGWATRETFVKPFADALFSMEKGEIRGPVKSEFGYHIIRLEDIEAGHQRSFDEVRPELEADYRREQAQSVFYERSQRLADESFAALSELDSVAKKLGLSLKQAEGFTRQGGATLGTDKKLIDAAFSEDVLVQRQNSAPIEVGNDRVVVLRVSDHQPPKQKPLEQVSGQITVELQQQKAKAAAEEAAKAAAVKLQSGASMAQVASELGATPSGPVTARRRAVDQPQELVTAIFAAPRPAEGKPSAGTASLPGGDVAVFVVNSARPGSMAEMQQAATFAQEVQQLAVQGAMSEFRAYVDELARGAEITRNSKLFE
jgi:peptidyl-prolyl cis-trans isomerase D